MTDRRSHNEIFNKRLADPLIARILLMTGGIFGLHRFYLEEIPESFIFITTGGVFLLGVAYDSFYIKKCVDSYNMRKLGEVEEVRKFRNGRLLPNLSKTVRFSLLRFLSSVAYAIWLGVLCWLASSITVGRLANDNLLVISALAAAVAIGVYVVGNCGMESRSYTYIWLGSFSSVFIHLRFIEEHFMRALLFASIISTILGNRTATVRTALHRPFNWKHLMFWTSLFGLLMCVIAVGATFHIFQKEVSATLPNKSRKATTVGTLLYDRFFNQQRAHEFFKNNPVLSFTPISSDLKKRNLLFDVDLADKAPLWADMVTVFVVDLLYQEVRVLEKRSIVEPLQWALWRIYLIVKFDSPAFISHRELRRTCAEWNKKQTTTKNKRDFLNRAQRSHDYQFLGLSRGCDVITK